MTAAVETRSLRLSMGLLEEDVSPGFLAEVEAEPAVMGPALGAWFEAALRRLEDHADLQIASPSTHIPAGSLDQIRVIFCSPSAMELVFDLEEHVLGLFLVDTPEHDPFRDESPTARALRVLVSWQPDKVRSLIEEAIQDDQGNFDAEDLHHGALSWLATLTHELHHALWFAGNGNFNSASDLDTLADEIGHDLFDIVTGYGIRPVVIAGAEIEPTDAENAHFLMEEMIEERGRRLAEDIFTGDLGPERFLNLLGTEIERAQPCEVQP